MFEKLLSKLPASTKIGFLKQFLPVLANIIESGYEGLELEEGEKDFCTTLFEDNRYNKKTEGSRLLAQVCTIDGTGKVIRSKLKIYDLSTLIGGINLDDKEPTKLLD